MKVLITEEQLKLIINEQNEDVKLSNAEKNILQNYIPIPKEQIAAYEQLKQYAESKGIKVKQLPELKNYPFNNKHMKKLLDKGGVFSQNVKPYDYHELVSGVISHNHAVNKNADGKWTSVVGGKKKFLDTPSSYDFKGGRLKKSLNNDLEIEELLNLKKLIDVASHLKNMGVPVDTITAGDDMFHRSSTKSNHQRSHAIDFTLTQSNDDIQQHMEESIAVLISRDPDLAENLTFSNEYYYPAANATGGHIHMAYGHPDKAQFRWLTDINGNQLRKGSNKKINKKIVDNPKYTELSKDRGGGTTPNEMEVWKEEGKTPLIIKDFDLNTGILSIDLDGIPSGVAFTLHKKDENGKFIPVPTFETKKGNAIPNSLKVSPKRSMMYDGTRDLNFQIIGQIPYYDNWDENYSKKGGDEFMPLSGDDTLKFMVQRQINDDLIGKPISTKEFFINEKGEMGIQKFVPIKKKVDYSSPCRPTGKVISPVTLITPQNPEGLPYGDWDWCDAKTKGDSYMGTTIYVDSKGREVVVNTSKL